MTEIRGLLLAAGYGRRYGGNKLSRAEIDGVAVGLISAHRFAQIVPTQIVVRAGDETTRGMYLAEGYEVIESVEAERGMGHSLASGVAGLPPCDGCMVGLADMPLISEATLYEVRNLLSAGHSLVRPQYDGRDGHPVGFAKRYFPELIKLQGDKGARDFLALHHAQMHYFYTDDSGTVADIDTSSDLVRLQGKP